MRLLNSLFSAALSVTMVLTALPLEASAMSGSPSGATTLCGAGGCASVLETYGAKAHHKASHKGSHKRPHTKPNKRPGNAHRPGNRPGHAERPGNRPGHKPGYKPNHKPGYKPSHKPHYAHHHRPPKWHYRPAYYRPYYRPWAAQNWYGAVIAGVTLGSIIAVAANTPPYAPSTQLCWYWANSSRTRGYWDYCY